MGSFLLTPKQLLWLPPIRAHNSFCCHISSSSVQPRPPTGHPEACWNTMPLLAQAPANRPNVEVTSSGKNGIVSLKKHNTLETLIGSKLLSSVCGLKVPKFQEKNHEARGATGCKVWRDEGSTLRRGIIECLIRQKCYRRFTHVR